MGFATNFALTLARATARWLPIGAVSATGGAVARVLGPRTRRQRRTLENIARAFPELSVERRSAIARESWDNFGRTIAESLIIDRIAADPRRVVLANPEVLAAGDASKGTIFAGLHFGNWETTAIPGQRHGLDLMGFYKASKDETFNTWLEAVRKPIYKGGLHPAAPATLLKLTKHVRRGGAACVLADHRDKTGVTVSFFGAPAPSAALPALLAVRYGARLMAARVDRLPGARFSVHLETVPVIVTGDEAADIVATSQALQAVFQRWITERPGQWVWFYKRWEGQR